LPLGIRTSGVFAPIILAVARAALSSALPLSSARAALSSALPLRSALPLPAGSSPCLTPCCWAAIAGVALSRSATHPMSERAT
jgi:hypothetical protein